MNKLIYKAIINILFQKQSFVKTHLPYAIHFSIFMQFFTIATFILITIPVSINQDLSSSVKSIQQILQTQNSISTAISISIIVQAALVIFLIYNQHRFISNKQLRNQNSHDRLIFITSLLCLIIQLLCIPCLVILVINLQNSSKSPLSIITNVTATLFLSPFIVAEPKRYFYNYYIIPLCLLLLLVNTYIYLILFIGLSILFALKQTSRFRTVSYFVFSWLLILQIITLSTGIHIPTLYLLQTTILLTVLIIYFFPDLQPKQNNENTMLLSYIQQMGSSTPLKNSDYYNIYQVIHRFSDIYAFKSIQRVNTSKQDQNIITNAKQQISRQTLKQFLIVKLQLNIKKHQFYLLSQMYLLECQLIDCLSPMQLIYKLLTFKQVNENIFSFQEHLQYQNLLKKCQRYLQVQQKGLNSQQIMAIEYQTQKFYQNIAVIIQNVLFIWQLIEKTHQKQPKLLQKTAQIIKAQDQCLKILKKLRKYRNLKQHIQVFNFLMKIINFHHQNILQTESQRQQHQQTLISTSYIHIVNHNINNISSNLSNQLNFDKNQLLNKNVNSTLPNNLKNYLQQNVQTLVDHTTPPKEIILPFIVNSTHSYIRPFRSKFCISIDLHNGFEYFIQIINSSDIRKQPLFLYELHSDQITNVTQNFYEYLNLPQEGINENIQGSSLFDKDISTSICQQKQPLGLTLNCTIRIVRLNKSFRNNCKTQHLQKAQLKVLQLYQINMQKIVLIQLKIINRQTKLSHLTLQQFIEQQSSQKDNKIQKKLSNLTQQHFCEIPTRFDSQLDQKMSRNSISVRISYNKIIWLLILMIITLVLIVMIIMWLEISAAGTNLSQIMTQSINTNTKIESIYLLMYQYYQYYQILNYPAQFLSIASYNLTPIKIQYKTKSLKNVDILKQKLYIDDLGHEDLLYQLKFEHYQVDVQTSSISLIDLMTKVVYAVSTNNPYLMVANQHIIDTIIASFSQPSLEPIHNLVYLLFQVFLSSLLIIITLIAIIKAFLLHLQSIMWQILNFYELISPQIISTNITNLNKYMQILQKSHLFLNKSNDNLDTIQFQYLQSQQQYPQLDNTIPIVSTSPNQKPTLKIQKSSTFKFIINNKLIWIIPLLTFIYFSFYYYQIYTERTQIINIINYGQNLQNSIAQVIKQAEKFFQASMQQLYTPQSKTYKSNVRNLSMQIKTDSLPKFFDQYKITSMNMIGFNLCQYSYLNTGSLYKNINCSLILNGVMDTSFSEAYAAYFDLVQSNLGVSIKDLGINRRIGAKYPVFMQICYLRRTVYNMLLALQTQFNSLVPLYMNQKSNFMSLVIQIGFVLIPILFLIGYFYMKQIKQTCRIGLKLFELLPRKFLLRRSTTKTIIKKNILRKISWLF